jgi:outer membrane immunogenic protein
MKTQIRLLTAALLLAGSTSVLAQDTTADWSGLYFGGHAGGTDVNGDGDSSIEFDNNADGDFGDTINTAAGANAFSPGFCDGAAVDRTPGAGCRGDDGGGDLGVRVGYDWQSGRWVFGALVEMAKVDARDSVSAFSTTPAFYTMTRDLESTVALRARVGYVFGAGGDWLAYATAGGVQGRIENDFRTSNGLNAFEQQGNGDASGWQAGVGVERKVLGGLSVGLEYLMTRLDDDGARIAVTQGSATASNPFILVDPDGTTFRRSDSDFDVSSLRLVATFRF